MEKEILQDALISALLLLENEFESLDNEDLKCDYLIVIKKLELAINEIKEDE